MGLNLNTVHLNEWLYSFDEAELPELKEELKQKVGDIPDDDSIRCDRDFPRVGSYTAYGIFDYCLFYLTKGDYESEIEPDEDFELIALREFRKYFEAGSKVIPYVGHFIATGDSDTIFLPVLFDEPFEFHGRFVASLPAAIKALESFSTSINFDLNSDFEDERIDDSWIPLATVKNVARIIYKFFIKNQNICIAFS